jgi:hypothetical protein
MSDRLESSLLFRMDIGALQIGAYVVLDRNLEIVRDFDTWDEAAQFVAAANKTDIETVGRDTKEHARMVGEYLNNLRRGKRGDS